MPQLHFKFVKYQPVLSFNAIKSFLKSNGFENNLHQPLKTSFKLNIHLMKSCILRSMRCSLIPKHPKVRNKMHSSQFSPVDDRRGWEPPGFLWGGYCSLLKREFL